MKILLRNVGVDVLVRARLMQEKRRLSMSGGGRATVAAAADRAAQAVLFVVVDGLGRVL